MNSILSSIETLFNIIDEKRVDLINQTGLVEEYFEKHLTEFEKEASKGLNEARDVLLERVKTDQIRLLSDPCFDDWISFYPCEENLTDSFLFNFDELNPNGNFNRDLVAFVRYSDFYVPRLNEIRFTEPNSQYHINLISVLTIGKIFIDISFIRNGDETATLIRKLIIINLKGEKLHELEIRPILDNLKTGPFIADNRIYIFNTSESDSDKYQVDIFDFKLNLQRTVLLNKDIRELFTNEDEICIDTTKNLKFYDLDLNFNKALGQKDNKENDFFIDSLKLVSFNENLLYFFANDRTKLICMSRQVGDVMSQVKFYDQVLSSYSLYNLGNDQIMYLNKLPSNTSPQKAMVKNSRGEILIEKPFPFFVTDISRTAYGTIVINTGKGNIVRILKNQDKVETIKFISF